MMKEMEEQGDGAEGATGVPMIKLGDASVAAPFTTKLPSIKSCVDIIRQGRCTLVNTVQQQQILVLNCMISAYSLSALSLEGSRASEAQLIASGMFLTTAMIAFSFTKPLDTLSKCRPLPSIFHPALFMSIMGQMLLHLFAMVMAVRLAKEMMGDDELADVISFNKTADKEFKVRYSLCFFCLRLICRCVFSAHRHNEYLHPHSVHINPSI
jgi:cation-transporting ATPase 13A1